MVVVAIPVIVGVVGGCLLAGFFTGRYYEVLEKIYAEHVVVVPNQSPPSYTAAEGPTHLCTPPEKDIR